MIALLDSRFASLRRMVQMRLNQLYCASMFDAIIQENFWFCGSCLAWMMRKLSSVRGQSCLLLYMCLWVKSTSPHDSVRMDGDCPALRLMCLGDSITAGGSKESPLKSRVFNIMGACSLASLLKIHENSIPIRFWATFPLPLVNHGSKKPAFHNPCLINRPLFYESTAQD